MLLWISFNSSSVKYLSPTLISNPFRLILFGEMTYSLFNSASINKSSLLSALFLISFLSTVLNCFVSICF